MGAVVEVRPMPLDLVVDIVNGWGDVPRAAARLGGAPYPDARSLRARNAGFWDGFGAVGRPALRRTANAIHTVFDTASGEQCAQRMNALVIEAGLVPALGAEGWSVRVAWRTTRPGRLLLASAVFALTTYLRTHHDARRLGVCRAPDCADAFVDTSPAGNRRFCSLTCQSRERARAYRARRRAIAHSRRA